jgi:transcriptional regulator with XRE-family HTH domain
MVGRPERQIDPADGSSAQFAQLLRELRQASGLRIAELAKMTFYSPSTLSMALSGKRLPTWQVTKKVVRACGDEASLVLWGARWEAAKQGRDPRTVGGGADGTWDALVRFDRRDTLPTVKADLDLAPPSLGMGVRYAGSKRRRRPAQRPRHRIPAAVHRETDLGMIRTLSELADHLDALRATVGLSWRQLAERSQQQRDAAQAQKGWSASTLHDAIVVRRDPPIGVVLRVVQLCGGTADDLIMWGEAWGRVVTNRPKATLKGEQVVIEEAPRTATMVFQWIFHLLERSQGSWSRTAQLVSMILAVPAAAAGTFIMMAVLLNKKSGIDFPVTPLLINAAFFASVISLAAALALRVVRKRRYRRQ